MSNRDTSADNCPPAVDQLNPAEIKRSLELVHSIFTHISHDMANPIAIVLTELDCLARTWRSHLPSEALTDFDDTVANMESSLGRLRAVYGNLSQKPNFDSMLVLSPVQVLAALRWGEARVEIQSPNPPDLRIVFPEMVLRAILHELITNASRHGAASQVAISWQCEEAYLTVTVDDNGTGFKDMKAAAEQPSKLFTEREGGLLYWERAVLRSGGLVLISRSEQLLGARVLMRLPIGGFLGATNHTSEAVR